MLKVWGRANSSNVQFVMWCIGEMGLEYERYDVGHKFGGNNTSEFLAMNPNGTVPVLKDGNNDPLWESAAIARYLASAYGDDVFWPKDHAKRAQVDRWAEWAKINVTQNFARPIFWPVVRLPKENQDQAAIAQAVANFENNLRLAEKELENNDYLTGADFTLADTQFGHLLYRYNDIDIERAELPALAAYYQRLVKRPAYKEHVMISYDDLRAK